MPTLTIRNLEEDVMNNLKTRAKQNNRSLEAEARQILKRLAGQKSPEELIALADKIAAMTPKNVEQMDSTEIIREFRDR